MLFWLHAFAPQIHVPVVSSSVPILFWTLLGLLYYLLYYTLCPADYCSTSGGPQQRTWAAVQVPNVGEDNWFILWDP